VRRDTGSPSLKIQKHKLREQGVTATTWDREAAGIAIGRTRLDQEV